MSDHQQPADEADEDPPAAKDRATHPTVCIYRRDPINKWPDEDYRKIPENTLVLTLNEQTGNAVVVTGPELSIDRYYNCDDFALPQGGRMLADDAPARILPEGIYCTDFEYFMEDAMQEGMVGLEFPAVTDGTSEKPPLVAQLRSGRQWLKAAKSLAPLPSVEELTLRCQDYWQENPLLGPFIKVEIYDTWETFCAKARQVAQEAIWGLESIRLRIEATKHYTFLTKWTGAEPRHGEFLRASLPTTEWYQEYTRPTDDGLGFDYSPIDLRESVPMQANVMDAWHLETTLQRGYPYLPPSWARALLAIWECVGAFIPLSNGTALICARTKVTAIHINSLPQKSVHCGNQKSIDCPPVYYGVFNPSPKPTFLATHSSVRLQQDSTDIGSVDLCRFNRVPDNTAVLSLNARTGAAVVITGPELHVDRSENYFLPKGGHMLADDAPARVLPAGSYSRWPWWYFPNIELPTELPVAPEGLGEKPPVSNQLQRGLHWLNVGRSRAPLPPADELDRLCRNFYEAESMLLPFYKTQIYHSWEEFAAAATESALQAKWGLEIIRRLAYEPYRHPGPFIWISDDPKRVKRLRAKLPKKPWNQDYQGPVEDDLGMYYMPIDLREAVPIQVNIADAWNLERILESGKDYVPPSAARALLSIWENVGAFIPLDNGTALICARTAETALYDQ